jgi:hypothetical protein
MPTSANSLLYSPLHLFTFWIGFDVSGSVRVQRVLSPFATIREMSGSDPSVALIGGVVVTGTVGTWYRVRAAG